MDWHKLQNKLFELDPTDPREDLAKLKAAAQGGSSGALDVAPAKDYVTESAEVPQGSLEMDRDYSVTDFAALAGIRIDEKQKMGSAGQAKGKDPMPKTSKPSTSGEQDHPLKDKLVGESDIEEGFWDSVRAGAANYNKLGAIKAGVQAIGPGDSPADSSSSSDDTKTQTSKDSKPPVQLSQLSQGDSFKDEKGMVWYYNPRKKNWMSKDRKQIISPEEGFKRWMKSTTARRRNNKESQIEALESRVAYLENVIETLLEGNTQPKIKPRDPNAQYMNDLRKSGAMGAHKNKKRDVKSGKVKHKNKQYESIKDELWAKLNASSKS